MFKLLTLHDFAMRGCYQSLIFGAKLSRHNSLISLQWRFPRLPAKAK